MFHVLKFTHTDVNAISGPTYVVLDGSEYQTFLDCNGCTTKFTDSQVEAEYAFVCDDLFPEHNQELRDLINDERLYALITNFLGGVCYEVTWTETMVYPYCTSSCVVNTNNARESKSVTLTPAQYQTFQAMSGEYYPFSLANNHSMCTSDHSCFRVWTYVGVRPYCGSPDASDLRPVVLAWLRSDVESAK